MPLIPIGSNTFTSPMAVRRLDRRAHQVGLHRRHDCRAVPRVHALDQSRRLSGLARPEQENGASHASPAAERSTLGHQQSPAPSTEDQPAGFSLSAEERREILRRRQPRLRIDANATAAVDRLVSALSVLQPQEERPDAGGEDDEQRSASRATGLEDSTLPVRPKHDEGRLQCFGNCRSAETDSARPASNDRRRPTIAASEAASQWPPLATPRAMSAPSATRLQRVGTVVARRVHGSSGGSR